MTAVKKKVAIKPQENDNEVTESETAPPLDNDDVSALLEQAPDVTQSVIDLENSKADAEAAQIKSTEAVANTFKPQGFDPNVHEVDAEGKPVLTPTGRFKKKGARAARAGEVRAKQTSTLGGVGGPAAQANNSVVNAQTAAVLTTLKETALTVMISDEFVMSVQEKATEVVLLTAALDHSYPEGVPVNPWLAYSAAVVTHAASRMGQPKTQTWLQRQKTRFAMLYLKLKGRKYAAHTGNGSDSIGENVASNEKDASNTRSVRS